MAVYVVKVPSEEALLIEPITSWNQVIDANFRWLNSIRAASQTKKEKQTYKKRHIVQHSILLLLILFRFYVSHRWLLCKGRKKNTVPAMRFKMKAQELFKSTKKDTNTFSLNQLLKDIVKILNGARKSFLERKWFTKQTRRERKKRKQTPEIIFHWHPVC